MARNMSRETLEQKIAVYSGDIEPSAREFRATITDE